MSTAEVVQFPVREVKRVADLDDGYTRIANEIYEAIIGSSLTQNQSKVAHAIVRLTYGYNKKNDRIADSQIAKITNLPRQKVNKAKNELIAMNIISREANKIGINKAIFEWDFIKCHQSNDNVTKTVTKNVTKVVTRVSPKQSHTKDIISKDNKNNNNSVLETSKNKIDFDLVMDAFNDAVEDKLPKVKKLTAARKTAIKNLLKEFEEPTFQNLANYFYDFVEQATPFYFGKNDRNWKADFDYIIKPAAYLKVLEGSL